MTSILIHNPNCSKSKQTLALLQAQPISFEVVEYLVSPLSAKQLKEIYQKLKLKNVRQMMRTKESEYSLMQLDLEQVSDEMLFDAMVKCPKLIERPIFIHNQEARIGRPPESVLEIL